MLFEIDSYAKLKTALRKMCADLSCGELPENAVFNCKLVANELLTNALQYGGGSARFTFVQEGSRVRITVKSAIEFAPPAVSVCSDINAERGRGLFLVDAISQERGYSPEEGISVILTINER